MARLEHIKRRLDNWALWKARQGDAGLGFHSRSILALDVWSRGSYNGMGIPHFEDEAVETDVAVMSLKLGQGHLYATLECIYLRELGVKMTAQRMRRAESTIKAHLEQADHAIAAWLDAKAVERERQRARAVAEARARQL